MSTQKLGVLFAVLLLLTSCSTPQPHPGKPTSSTLQPSSTPERTPSSPGTLSFEVASSTPASPFDGMPELWTKINPDKITFYPYDQFVYDYAYASDGSVWLAGAFGIIHQTAAGKQTWYSVKNGLPNNTFTTIAISPTGDVWAGGPENLLLRFDGNNWIDEGERIPSTVR